MSRRKPNSNTKSRPEPPLPRGWRRGLLAALCVGHLLFLVIGLIPPRLRNDGATGSVLGTYEKWTGTEQRWDMFETIPQLHKLEVGLMEVRSEGAIRRSRVILPELDPYPVPESARHYGLFHRLIWQPDGPDYANAYLKRVADQLAASPRPPEAIALQVDAWHTRSLRGVKALGEIAVNKVATYGPVPVAEPVPESKQ